MNGRAIKFAVAMFAIYPRGAAAGDDSLTWGGVTLYGAIDVGVTYQTHATPLASSLTTGLEYAVTKNGNGHYFGFGPSGLSMSRIGVVGTESCDDAIPGWAFVFKLETSFVPTSGRISDSLAEISQNGGVPLNRQGSNADSGRAGQIFNQEAYGGVSSQRYGTLTFGRQTSLELDGVLAYDPMGASNAFSIIGYFGTTGGFGSAEDSRLDRAIKYRAAFDPVRVAVLYQFPEGSGQGGRAYEFDLGYDWNGLSVDGLYNSKHGEISASALSPTQTNAPNGSIAATISDTQSQSLLARYTLNQVALFAGWERIIYANPSDPIAPGYKDIGGYIISIVANKAFTNQKMLDVDWMGADYSLTPDLKLIGAWYHYYQHSYQGNRCANSTSGACAGTLDAFSGVLTDRLSAHVTVYGGAMLSTVSGGLANAYLHTTSVDPMVGVQFGF